MVYRRYQIEGNTEDQSIVFPRMMSKVFFQYHVNSFVPSLTDQSNSVDLYELTKPEPAAIVQVQRRSGIVIILAADDKTIENTRQTIEDKLTFKLKMDI